MPSAFLQQASWADHTTWETQQSQVERLSMPTRTDGKPLVSEIRRQALRVGEATPTSTAKVRCGACPAARQTPDHLLGI